MSSPVNGEIREADWMSLVYAVQSGTCTLMLGPDAVTGTLDGRHLPIHVALAQYVKDRLEPPQPQLDPNKPSSVAEKAMALEDQFTLQGWVKEFYDAFVEDEDVLTALAALPFELVINSSPATSVQEIFSKVKPDTFGDFYDRTAPSRQNLPDPTVEAPVVYHLYGSLDHPPSLVLSDSDRLDFIVSVISDDPPLPPKLKSALSDPDRSFLFLGFDLDHWQFRVFLHVLSRGARRQNKSFALESRSDSLDWETQDFYRIGHKVHFVNGDLLGFTHELGTRVSAELPQPTSARRKASPLPDAPLVFLCHASEDKGAAERLASDLESNGIRSWLDKEDLKVGDQWKRSIERAISEEADYVAVLQSENMASKDIAYVNLEINLALDRQKYFRANRRFILPVTIGADPNVRLQELGSWQSVDISQPDGVDRLIREIKRDLNKALRNS